MRKTLFILFFAFIILSCRSEYDPVADEDNVQYTGHEQEVQEVFELVNQTRAKINRYPLILHEKLNAAAAIRAKELSILYHPRHIRPNGTSWYTVSKEVPGCPEPSAENIARYQKTPQAVMNDWINSQGHYNNIIASHSYIGIGVYKDSNGKLYWVQLFR